MGGTSQHWYFCNANTAWENEALLTVFLMAMHRWWPKGLQRYRSSTSCANACLCLITCSLLRLTLLLLLLCCSCTLKCFLYVPHTLVFGFKYPQRALTGGRLSCFILFLSRQPRVLFTAGCSMQLLLVASILMLFVLPFFFLDTVLCFGMVILLLKV